MESAPTRSARGRRKSRPPMTHVCYAKLRRENGKVPQKQKPGAKCVMPRFSHYWATLLYKSITSGLGGRYLVAHPVGFAAQGQAPDFLTWRRSTK